MVFPETPNTAILILEFAQDRIAQANAHELKLCLNVQYRARLNKVVPGTKILNRVCHIIGVHVVSVDNTQSGVELFHIANETRPTSFHSIKAVYEVAAFDIKP